MKKFLVLVLSIIVCYGHLAAQSEEPAFVRDSLDVYINRALKDWKIPALAVAIVKDGKIVLAKGYGYANLEKSQKADENTLFLIGSNTKAFTGTLLSWLAYDKKCSLDDKLEKWLPGFKMKDRWVGGQVNLTDILCHRMGMETYQGDFMYWTSNLTRSEVVQKFGELTPLYGFRTKWGYTNAGFLIAGECIGKISGESWELNLKKRILDPLQMTRTVALSVDYPKQTNIATPYTLVFDTLKALPYPDMDNLAPAASIGSSVKDMSNWLLCQLDSGKFRGSGVIPFSVIKSTRIPRSIEGNSRSPFNHSHYRLYGLGWELQDYEGREIVSHTGGVNGFVTSVTLLPEEKLGIVVLTNTDQNSLYQALKWEIVDAYLKLPYRGYSNIYNKYYQRNLASDLTEYKAQKDSIAMNQKPETDLKNFTGRYVHPVYGYLDMTQNKNQLKATFQHHPGLSAKLEYMGKNRFLCTFSDPTYGIKVWDFKVDNKKVTSLTLRVADFLEFTEYEFMKQD